MKWAVRHLLPHNPLRVASHLWPIIFIGHKVYVLSTNMTFACQRSIWNEKSHFKIHKIYGNEAWFLCQPFNIQIQPWSPFHAQVSTQNINLMMILYCCDFIPVKLLQIFASETKAVLWFCNGSMMLWWSFYYNLDDHKIKFQLNFNFDGKIVWNGPFPKIACCKSRVDTSMRYMMALTYDL